MKKKRTRILLILSAVILLPSFLFPIWRIGLTAPQYPEGMQLEIWLHQVAGGTPYDLQNINKLNHYIGMKPIVSDSIPELRFMPYLVLGLALAALLLAWKGRRRWVGFWLIAFLMLGAAGLVDFYLWQRDYGSDLDPTAPIKVPGMTYQPPLLGSKQLLNIRATSYPATGTVFLFLGFALAALAWWSESRRIRGSMVVPVLVMASCTMGPEPLRLNEDSCLHCGMLISDPRFGGQQITSKGRVFKFDSIECLGRHLVAGAESGEGGSLWVIDFARPGVWVEARSAHYLLESSIQSPMGLSLLAFSSPDEGRRVAAQSSGRLAQWDEVVGLIRHEPARHVHIGAP